MLEIARLREENERLREEVRQLRVLLVPDIPLPPEWNLPRREAQVFRALLAHGTCSGRRLFDLIYDADSETEEVVIQSHVSKMRKKLRPFGVVIWSKRHEGYRLEDRQEWKEKLMAWWDRASDAQRSAQVRGGKALGMTAEQIAVASASPPEVVEDWIAAQSAAPAKPKASPKEVRPVFDRAADRAPAADDFMLDDALGEWASS